MSKRHDEDPGLGCVWGLLLAFGVAGCFVDDGRNVPETGSGTDLTTTSSTTEPETTGPCVPGELGCGCDSGCQAGLICMAFECAIPVCGNGLVEGFESCDDGDQDNGNGCNTDCRISGSLQWQILVNGPANGNDSGSDVAVDTEQNIHFNGLLIGTGNVPLRWQASVRPDKTPLGTSANNFPVNYVTKVYGLAAHKTVLVDVGIHSSALSNDNIWVRQRDADGQIWSHSLDAFGLDDAGIGVAIDGAGNVVVVGYESNEEGRDASLIKFDSTGETLFEETYNHSGVLNDEAYAVAILSDDSIVVTGAVGFAADDQNAWVALYDPQGVEKWSRVFAGSFGFNDAASAVAVNADDEIFTAGFVGAGDEDTHLWIARLGSDGAPMWEK
ncbi:MAG: hypothetical protein ACPG4T_15950, partial [Nannocystaceae bacterium]